MASYLERNFWYSYGYSKNYRYAANSHVWLDKYFNVCWGIDHRWSMVGVYIDLSRYTLFVGFTLSDVVVENMCWKCHSKLFTLYMERPRHNVMI